MPDNTITLIAVSALYICGIFGSCGIMVLAVARNNRSLFPYFAASCALFSSTVGLAVALKMQGAF